MVHVSRIHMLMACLITFCSYGMEDDSSSSSLGDQQSAIIDPYGPKTYSPPPSSLMSHPAFVSYVIFKDKEKKSSYVVLREKESSHIILKNQKMQFSNFPSYGPVFTWAGQQQYPTDNKFMRELLDEISLPEESMSGWGEPWAEEYKYRKDSEGAGTVGDYINTLGRVITLYRRTLKGGIENMHVLRPVLKLCGFNKKKFGKIIIQDTKKLEQLSAQFFLDTESNKVIFIPPVFAQLLFL